MKNPKFFTGRIGEERETGEQVNQLLRFSTFFYLNFQWDSENTKVPFLFCFKRKYSEEQNRYEEEKIKTF